MKSDARRWIAALRRSHDELVADVAALTDDDLRQPSGSAAWDVSKVLGHLGSGAEIGAPVLPAALAGTDPPGNQANEPIWERWNAMTPDKRLAEFLVWDERFVVAFEQLDDATMETLQIRLPFLPFPVDVASAVGFRLSEHALHSWDVRVAFRPDATVAGYAAELLIDRVPMMAGFVGKADAWHGSPLTLAIVTTDPARQFWLELGDKVSLGTEARSSDGTMELPAEALLRLSAGRLAPGRTPASVTIEGPATLDDLRAVFPGY